MNRLFKIIGVVFAILCLWAAYLQYNDPDAFLWYIIYGLAAIGSLLFAYGKLNFMFSIILSFLYLLAIQVENGYYPVVFFPGYLFMKISEDISMEMNSIAVFL